MNSIHHSIEVKVGKWITCQSESVVGLTEIPQIDVACQARSADEFSTSATATAVPTGFVRPAFTRHSALGTQSVRPFVQMFFLVDSEVGRRKGYT